MPKHSKDILDEVEAGNAIVAIEDPKELRIFIRGEQRDRLLDTAEYRLRFLEGSAKQGQTGPITQPVAEFKGSGVQGTKGAGTIADIVAPIDAADAKRADDAHRSALEAEKAAASGTPGPKKHVSCEDVITSMRQKGARI